MPLFLVDFGAWLSQPSVDFAREVSAESSENKGFRACSDYSLLPSRKRVELIWFEKIDFPKSITEILLNIRIFLENFGSSLKKSILFKLLRTLRRIIFLWILPWRVDVKYHFTRLYATKDAKNYRRKAF